jgi:hypothetical protein
MDPKILITGTGRSGTTFLIILLTHLGMDTGFDINNLDEFIFDNCNAGMERHIDSEHQVLKNPLFIQNMDEIVKTHKIKMS